MYMNASASRALLLSLQLIPAYPAPSPAVPENRINGGLSVEWMIDSASVSTLYFLFVHVNLLRETSGLPYSFMKKLPLWEWGVPKLWRRHREIVLEIDEYTSLFCFLASASLCLSRNQFNFLVHPQLSAPYLYLYLT
jgi:hypothetical protein